MVEGRPRVRKVGGSMTSITVAKYASRCGVLQSIAYRSIATGLGKSHFVARAVVIPPRVGYKGTFRSLIGKWLSTHVLGHNGERGVENTERCNGPVALVVVTLWR